MVSTVIEKHPSQYTREDLKEESNKVKYYQWLGEQRAEDRIKVYGRRTLYNREYSKEYYFKNKEKLLVYAKEYHRRKKEQREREMNKDETDKRAD